MRLLTEDVISMAEAAKELPSRPHVSTMWRWANRGLRGHKLETVKIGGRTVTSKQAITRFLHATNGEVGN